MGGAGDLQSSSSERQVLSNGAIACAPVGLTALSLGWCRIRAGAHRQSKWHIGWAYRLIRSGNTFELWQGRQSKAGAAADGSRETCRVPLFHAPA